MRAEKLVTGHEVELEPDTVLVDAPIRVSDRPWGAVRVAIEL